MFEAIFTFACFPILLGIAYGADTCNKKEEDNEDVAIPEIAMKYNVTDFYKNLLAEQQGEADQSKEAQEARREMKETLKEHFKTDNIQEVDKDELKQLLEGKSLLSRISYRKQIGISNVVPKIAKGQIYKFEH